MSRTAACVRWTSWYRISMYSELRDNSSCCRHQEIQEHITRSVLLPKAFHWPWFTCDRTHPLTLRSSTDVGLSSGSFLRHTEMKSMNTSDQFSGLCNLGGSFWAMWYRALMAFMWKRGGLRSAKQRAQQTDHKARRVALVPQHKCCQITHDLDRNSTSVHNNNLPSSMHVIPTDQISTYSITKFIYHNFLHYVS